MNHGSVLRRLLTLIAALLLLAFAWWIVSDGLRNLRQATTLGQYAETFIRFACGLLSVAVVVTRFRWGVLGRPVRLAWAATLAVAGGLSALVWGPPIVHIALINAVVALLVAWALTWALGPALAARHLATDVPALVDGFVVLCFLVIVVLPLGVLISVFRRNWFKAQRTAWTQTVGADGLKPIQHAARERVDMLVSDWGTQVEWSTEPSQRGSATLVLVGEAPSISLSVGLEEYSCAYQLGKRIDYMEGMDYESPDLMTDALLSSLGDALRRARPLR